MQVLWRGRQRKTCRAAEGIQISQEIHSPGPEWSKAGGGGRGSGFGRVGWRVQFQTVHSLTVIEDCGDVELGKEGQAGRGPCTYDVSTKGVQELPNFADAQY